MKLISAVHILRFRSIRDARLTDLGDFSALAGLNNAGKSNFLRALCAFFTDTIDGRTPLRVDHDFYCFEQTRRQKKRISVEVTFSLPDFFKFRHSLKPVHDLLGRDFTIRKEWTKDDPRPRVYLNGASQVLEGDDKDMSVNGSTGGVDDIKSYLRHHAAAIKSRPANSPIVVILDWDAESKKQAIERTIPEPQLKVLVWPVAQANPKLGATFHGIERFMSDRIIGIVESGLKTIARNGAGIASVPSDEYGKVKAAIHQVVVENLYVDDLKYSAPFLRSILTSLNIAIPTLLRPQKPRVRLNFVTGKIELGESA